jgi:hypothetical protein
MFGGCADQGAEDGASGGGETLGDNDFTGVVIVAASPPTGFQERGRHNAAPNLRRSARCRAPERVEASLRTRDDHRSRLDSLKREAPGMESLFVMLHDERELAYARMSLAAPIVTFFATMRGDHQEIRP